MRKIVAISILALVVFSIITFGGYVIVREYIIAREENEVLNVSIPVQGASKADVAEMLMVTWFQQFTARRYLGRIYDYRIDSIKIDEEGNNYFCFVAEYSVKADKDTIWKNVRHTVHNDWIIIKGRFRVNKVENRYNLIVF
jgi:hypothetical protein